MAVDRVLGPFLPKGLFSRMRNDIFGAALSKPKFPQYPFILRTTSTPLSSILCPPSSVLHPPSSVLHPLSSILHPLSLIQLSYVQLMESTIHRTLQKWEEKGSFEVLDFFLHLTLHLNSECFSPAEINEHYDEFAKIFFAADPSSSTKGNFNTLPLLLSSSPAQI